MGLAAMHYADHSTALAGSTFTAHTNEVAALPIIHRHAIFSLSSLS